MRFRTLLTLVVLIPLLAASIAVIALMYANANRRNTEMGERLLAAATAQASLKVQTQSMQAAHIALALASLGEETLPITDSDRLILSLVHFLRANPGITWLSFSNPAGDFTGAYRDTAARICTNQSHIVDGKTQLVEYILADDNSKTLLRQDSDSGYDPRTRPFYLSAAKSNTVFWSDPYIFYNQSIPGISCSKAVYFPANQLRGVFSVDYDLNRLSDFARQVAASPNSQVMAFTTDRILIAHSSIRVVPTANQRGTGKLLTLADVEDPVTHAFQLQITPLSLPALDAGKPHLVSFDIDGKPFIGCIMPVQLENGPLQYVATIAPKADFAPSAWESSRFAILATAAALLIAMVAAILLANRISAPLTTLVHASQKIGAGDLDIKFNLGQLHEFRHLNQALDAMLANLRDWVRVRTAINLAMEVQRRLLPAAPPVISGYDIAGYSAYCDETGGDYYDFIVVDRIDRQHFIVALGDVMGHGLPSALFMAGARGILRSGISAHDSPGALLIHLNNLLYRDTEGKRFMTMCIASFDITSALCTWGSAGHDPPIIFDPATGNFHEPEGGGVPLGVMEDVDYGNGEFGPLIAGQVLIIGSDGVWETFSPDGEQFGKERLKKIMSDHAQKPAEEIKTALIHALHTFRGHAPVRDDVTFVIIKVTKSPTPPNITPAPDN